MKQTKPIKVSKKVEKILDMAVKEKAAKRERLKKTAMVDVSNIKPI